MQMNNYKITFTRRAKEDILDIGDYVTYTLLEPEIARNLVKGLRQAIATLHMMPNRYAIIDDPALASQHIRCMPYKNYYIFYEVIDAMDIVVILRVGYNRRNWKDILTR